MLDIFVDADACPVKPEIFRVAGRYQLTVTLVANSWMRIPADPRITLKVVDDGFDAADNWIVEHLTPGDIVITTDVQLASRCIAAGASALGPAGKLFTSRNIGQVVASRNLMAELRDAGEITSGPPPMTARNRSQFLQQLDEVIQSTRRKVVP